MPVAVGLREVRVVLLFAMLALSGEQYSVAASSPNGGMAASITAEAIKLDNESAEHPLPLFSHWNTGKIQAEGWAPKDQLAMIRSGHFILPWFEQPDDGKDTIEKNDQAFRDYIEGPLREARALRLPIAMVGSQWERFLSADPYLSLPGNSNLVDRTGAVRPVLTPFGDVRHWSAVGKMITKSARMQQIQAWYPDPPLVVFVSNNEHPRVPWSDAATVPAFVIKYGLGASDDLKQKVFSDGWAERYRALQDGMREGLVSDQWRRAALFVGYKAFGPIDMGHSSGWRDGVNFLPGPGLGPDRAWDGASVSYYTNGWNGSNDFSVWSPQIEAMNLVFQKSDVLRRNPRFWFEMSVWDGYEPDRPERDKRRYYRNRNQEYSPARYAGMVQFGMWLLRPRIVREFRGFSQAWADCRPYTLALVKAVDRVHRNPALSVWWRVGNLLENRQHNHPYQSAIPEEYSREPRWFLLESDANPSHLLPSTLGSFMQQEIPVFALALTQGHAPSRRWLVYAFSPRGPIRGTKVTIPDYGTVQLDSPVGGAYYEVTEGESRLTRIE